MAKSYSCHCDPFLAKILLKSLSLITFYWLHDSIFVVSELQEQLQRAMMLDQERRRAEEEAIRLESERQAALVAKEELAREAENQKKSQEQLVSILMTPFNYLKLKFTPVTESTNLLAAS